MNDTKTPLKERISSVTIGVYKIVNKINNRWYVGSTTNLRNRARQHRDMLKKGIHDNDHLQKAFNKYGIDCFDFQIIAVFSTLKEAVNEEQRWLDSHFKKPYCYNLKGKAILTTDDLRTMYSEKGKKHVCSPERREYLRQKQLSLLKDPEYIKKQKEGMQRVVNDPTYRKRLSDGLKKAHANGKYGESWKKKMKEHGNKLKGIPRSEEVCRKVSETQLRNKKQVGKKHTAEHCQKISLGLRLAYQEGRGPNQLEPKL